MPEMNNMKVGNDVYEVADPKSRGVSLTWAQYQALSYEEQHNGTAYYITDRDAIYPVDHELNANSSHAVANDVVTPHILAMENVLGAKNVLPLNINDPTLKDSARNPGTWSGNSYTLYGATLTFDVTDGGYIKSIALSGTASNDFVVWLNINNRYSEYNGFILSGKPVTDKVEAGLTLPNSPWTTYVTDIGEDVVISGIPQNTYVGYQFTIHSGNLLDGIVLYPMIRPAGTDPTYVKHAMTNSELTDEVEELTDKVKDISTFGPGGGEVALVCSKLGNIIIVGLQGTFTDGYPQWGYFSIPYEISRIFYQVSTPFFIEGGHRIKANTAISPGETVAWYAIGYVE